MNNLYCVNCGSEEVIVIGRVDGENQCETCGEKGSGKRILVEEDEE